MGEIRSTLDLVMEKTRHLTLSDAEKKSHLREATVQKIQGIIHGYSEERLHIAEVAASLSELKIETAEPVDSLFITELITGIELGEENEIRFELLKHFGRFESADLKTVCREYQRQLCGLADERTAELKRKLSKNRGISGSAVMPNLALDPGWPPLAADLMEQFSVQLEREKRSAVVAVESSG
jgi:hypothetical protein